MADKVKPIEWGRIREWNGSKGCPPVAVGNLCAVFEWEWVGLDYPGLGEEWTWAKEVTAYRLEAEFDHLDDYGNSTDPYAGVELLAIDNPLKPWEDLFWEAYRGPIREGAAARILRDGAAKLLGVTL